MTLTTQRSRRSSRSKFSRFKKTIKRSLTGVGFLSVTAVMLLAFNSTLCAKAANALANWASIETTTLNTAFALAPFEFEDPHDLEKSDVSVALANQSYSKLPVATIAALPIMDLYELTDEQAKVARWIAKRYAVAPEMVALLVKEAWVIGDQKNIDPTLILGIVAIESRFNPYAQSPVGATGLMQIMTEIHAAKLERTGGSMTVFDPVTNMRVGVQVLEEHVRRAGSLEGGLKQYVGATGPGDYGYGAKVLAERNRIRGVIFGPQAPTLEAILAAGRAPIDPSEA